MFQHEIQIRVRYSETDQMGFVYYGNYAAYFEVARVECLRKLGVQYKELEGQGVWLPVVNYSIEYKKPAEYDDQLNILTQIVSLPGARISFAYVCTNQNGELIARASTDLVFLNAETKRPMRCPEEILSALAPHF